MEDINQPKKFECIVSYYIEIQVISRCGMPFDRICMEWFRNTNVDRMVTTRNDDNGKIILQLEHCVEYLVANFVNNILFN